MTPSKGVGRGRKGIPRHPYSVKQGKKLCKGPLHSEGVWLPATNKYFYPRKDALTPTFYSTCRRCRNFNNSKTHHPVNGWIMVSEVVNVFRELEYKIGRKETERRLGLGSTRLKNILDVRQRRIQARTFHKALKLLFELRETGEVRSRKDIKWGRAARGYEEFLPSNASPSNFNGPNAADSENARRRRERLKAATT